MEDNQLITKSNALIQGTINNMTVKEVKLMAVLLAEYKKYYDTDNTLTQTILNRREFLNYLDVSVDSGRNYEILNNVLENFQQQAYCKWVNQDKKTNNITPYFKNIEYNTQEEQSNNNIVFTWNEYITPMVVGLDANFTKIFKRNILSLQSKKAITLYELLKSYAGRTFPPTITIEELKEKLDMKSPSYNVFKDFYKRGIADPIKEINENTDIFVSVIKNKDNKDKRKVVSITFKIKDKSEKKIWWDEYPNIKLTEEEYRTVTSWSNCKFYIRQLNDVLSAGKVIRNHFKQLEKYHNSKNTSEQINFDYLYR